MYFEAFKCLSMLWWKNDILEYGVLWNLKHFETFTVKCFCKYGISKYILRLWKIKMISLHKPRKTKFYSFPHNYIKLRNYFFMHVSVHSTSHDTLSAGTSCARLLDLHANVWLNVLLFYIMHFFPVVGLLHKVHDKNKVVVKKTTWLCGKRTRQDDITIAGFN